MRAFNGVNPDGIQSQTFIATDGLVNYANTAVPGSVNYMLHPGENRALSVQRYNRQEIAAALAPIRAANVSPFVLARGE